jgi:hypothetical protein
MLARHPLVSAATTGWTSLDEFMHDHLPEARVLEDFAKLPMESRRRIVQNAKNVHDRHELRTSLSRYMECSIQRHWATAPGTALSRSPPRRAAHFPAPVTADRGRPVASPVKGPVPREWDPGSPAGGQVGGGRAALAPSTPVRRTCRLSSASSSVGDADVTLPDWLVAAHRVPNFSIAASASLIADRLDDDTMARLSHLPDSWAMGMTCAALFASEAVEDPNVFIRNALHRHACAVHASPVKTSARTSAVPPGRPVTFMSDGFKCGVGVYAIRAALDAFERGGRSHRVCVPGALQ